MLFGFCASWLGTSVRILQRTAPACPTYFSGVASTLKISCPPGASTEVFNCSALSRPAAKASCPVAKPPFCSTTRFREAYSTNFHAIGFSPTFIFRLKGGAQPLDFRSVALGTSLSRSILFKDNNVCGDEMKRVQNCSAFRDLSRNQLCSGVSLHGPTRNEGASRA